MKNFLNELLLRIVIYITLICIGGFLFSRILGTLDHLVVTVYIIMVALFAFEF